MRWIGLGLGPVLCVAVVALPTPEGLTVEGQAALAVLALCVTWWLTVPVPLPVTSLVGLAMLPVLGAMPVTKALALFANPAVFFIIGIFLVAAVMFRTGLSTRVALLALRRLPPGENALCVGVLVVSCLSCAVVVSHAVAALLLPLVLEIIRALDLGLRSRTARRLLLSMAWGTVCGSNLGLLSSARASLALEFYGAFVGERGAAPTIGFLEFSLAALPIVVGCTLITGLVLRWAFPPEGIDLQPALDRLNQRVQEQGGFSWREGLAIGVLALMVTAMVVSGPTWLAPIALIAGAALFVFRIIDWDAAERDVNWGVVFLYGGAIAVGTALHVTGATGWIVDEALGGRSPNPWALLWMVSAGTGFLTEAVSNSAVIAVMLPVMLGAAEVLQIRPEVFPLLVSLSAGFAFALPTSTPALAMVFGTGHVQVAHTLWLGMLLTLVSSGILLFVVRFYWPLIGIQVMGGS